MVAPIRSGDTRERAIYRMVAILVYGPTVLRLASPAHLFEEKPGHMRDVALICGDGAIKGGFIAGAVSRLLERFPGEMERIKIITASSASVGSMCYYLSHYKEHPGRHIWTESLSSSEFIDFNNIKDLYREQPIYNIEYMTSVVFKKNHPLDEQKIHSSPIDFFFPVYNIDLKRVEVFTNRNPDALCMRDGYPFTLRNMTNYDIYTLIKASNSAPFVYDKPVLVGDYNYIDAAAWVPHLIDVPGIQNKKKLVIVTKHDNTFRRRLNYALMGYSFPFLVAPFRKNRLPVDAYFQYGRKPGVIAELAREMSTLHRYDNLFTISPKRRLGSLTDNSRETLLANFQHGVDLVDQGEDALRRFFND